MENEIYHTLLIYTPIWSQIYFFPFRLIFSLGLFALCLLVCRVIKFFFRDSQPEASQKEAPYKLDMIQKHRPDERYFDLHFLTVSYFALHARTDQRGITSGSEPFQPNRLSPSRKRSRLLVESEAFVRLDLHRPARAVCTLVRFFFPEAEAYWNQRYGKYFQCEGFSQVSSRSLPETCPIRISCTSWKGS